MLVLDLIGKSIKFVNNGFRLISILLLLQNIKLRKSMSSFQNMLNSSYMSFGRIIVSVRSTSGEIIAGIIIIPSIVQVFKHSFEHIKHLQ